MGAVRPAPVDVEAAIHPFLVTSAFGLPVCRLGLASYGQTAITPDDVLSAIGRGSQLPQLGGARRMAVRRRCLHRRRGVPRRRRDRRSSSVPSSGHGTGPTAAEELRSVLSTLGTDYIDVLTALLRRAGGRVGGDRRPGGALRYLQDAKRDGVVRRIGVTSHQRALAAEMARERAPRSRHDPLQRGPPRRRAGRVPGHRPLGCRSSPTPPFVGERSCARRPMTRPGSTSPVPRTGTGSFSSTRRSP